jgi:hypothetical protein
MARDKGEKPTEQSDILWGNIVKVTLREQFSSKGAQILLELI